MIRCMIRTANIEYVMLCALTYCSLANPIGYIKEIAHATHG